MGIVLLHKSQAVRNILFSILSVSSYAIPNVPLPWSHNHSSLSPPTWQDRSMLKTTVSIDFSGSFSP
jgi:hypothetical protein